MPPTLPNYKLNCLISGDDPTDIFEITIAPIENVGALKGLIKETMKPQFDHVPADKLIMECE